MLVSMDVTSLYTKIPQEEFLTVYVLVEIFVYLFTVSPISTTVLNTYDT